MVRLAFWKMRRIPPLVPEGNIDETSLAGKVAIATVAWAVWAALSTVTALPRRGREGASWPTFNEG